MNRVLTAKLQFFHLINKTMKFLKHEVSFNFITQFRKLYLYGAS